MKEHQTITPESILASVKEMFAEIRAETAKTSAEFDRRMEEFDRRIKELENTGGKWLDDYRYDDDPSFYECLDLKNQKYFGEYFYSSAAKSSGPKKNGDKGRYEYGIQLWNDKSVGLMEYVFDSDCVAELINKAQTYREDDPYYKTHQVYLGAIIKDFDHELETECIREGIAILRKVGNKIVVNDEQIKAF